MWGYPMVLCVLKEAINFQKRLKLVSDETSS